MMVDLSVGEIHLLVAALAKASARHESQAKATPGSAGYHDRTADSMRELRKKLMQQVKH
jgi:hypothetical protein